MDSVSKTSPLKARLKFKDCFGIAFFSFGLYFIICGFLGAVGFDTFHLNNQTIHGWKAALLAIPFSLLAALAFSIVIYLGYHIYRFFYDLWMMDEEKTV